MALIDNVIIIGIIEINVYTMNIFINYLNHSLIILSSFKLFYIHSNYFNCNKNKYQYDEYLLQLTQPCTDYMINEVLMNTKLNSNYHNCNEKYVYIQ